MFLLLQFAALIGHLQVRPHGLELEVRGEPRNRYPELTLIRKEHIQQLRLRNTVKLSMAPPLLVVEVVSPGDLQRDRDYIAKRSQYQDRGIPEYWIIEPQLKTVLVLELTETTYTEVATFSDQLNVTAAQIFAAGNQSE